jgi:dTDP-4-dehydrorhamnose 3,5-epimerase
MGRVGEINIEGVILTPEKQICHPGGDLFHVIKKSSKGFAGFGEAYFSTVLKGETKAWKKHTSMTLNFVVPAGEIRIVIFDDRQGSPTKGNFFDITLSPENYRRLTIPPRLWVAFSGTGSGLNLLLNIANIEHDPDETERKENLSEITYTWQ